MFNSGGSKERSGVAVETLIGASTHVEGSLRVQGSLRVDGRVTGQLSVDGRCEVGADGYVEATVSATELIVAGQIAGDVEVTGRLHILSTGSIVGDVRTRVLVVEEGGTLDGRCLMAKEGGSARQEKEKNAAPKDAAASQPA